MKLIINFLCQLKLEPELMERMWHQRWTANHNTEQVQNRASKIQNSFIKG